MTDCIVSITFAVVFRMITDILTKHYRNMDGMLFRFIRTEIESNTPAKGIEMMQSTIEMLRNVIEVTLSGYRYITGVKREGARFGYQWITGIGKKAVSPKELRKDIPYLSCFQKTTFVIPKNTLLGVFTGIFSDLDIPRDST